MKSCNKILVIEDSKTVSDNINYILQKLDILVDVADTGKRAFELLSLSKYNLVILDLLLPDIDGEKILLMIREKFELEILPVIVVSSINEDKRIIQLLKSGANDFLTKPFNELILKQKVKILLESQNKTESILTYNDSFKDIIDNTPILSAIVDENIDNIKILRANKIFLEYFGKKEYDPANLYLKDLININDHSKEFDDCNKNINCAPCLFKKVMVETINSQKNIYKREFEIITTSGDLQKKVFFQISTTRIIYYNSQAVLLTVNDITDEKEKNIELQNLNFTKDKFISIISHDLKNPLSGILGISELLVNNYADFDEDKTKELLENINSASKNSLIFLENLLVWGKNQSGEIKLKREKINLYNLVNEVLTLVNISIKSKKLNVKIEIKEDLNIFADKNMLYTVLRNLITNSIKFSNENGVITVTATIKNGFVEVSVIDNGIGMNQKIKDTLFKLGEKNTRPGTNQESGSGLGLLLSKEFIDKHNGKFFVESEEGRGSLFKFIIPDIKES